MPEPASKRGGKRAGSGRRKLNRHPVSARVSTALYAELQRQAQTRGITLSALIESLLEEVVAYLIPRRPETKATPDFAAFFRKHPLIAGGDEVLHGLLQEREESL